MADTVSTQRRSEIMSKIRGKHTTPELRVRRYLHSQGFRYRLHAKELPGRPDVVFRRKMICVYVHGCFWHGCTKCVDGTRRVKSNITYWQNKIANNRDRDRKNREELEQAGWKVLTIWECETMDQNSLNVLTHEINKHEPSE